MKYSVDPAVARPPTPWAVILALIVVYLAWGTGPFAIKVGVRELPPALFAGVRVGLAGLVLLVYLALRGESLRLSGRELAAATVSGLLLFAGGNGLLTAAEQTVDSAMAAILVTTTPLWMALLEMLWPGGDRLTIWGWLGLLVGFGGTLLVGGAGGLTPAALFQDAGPLMLLGSAFAWALGSLVVRYQRRNGPHLTAAAYQMFLGGSGLAFFGLALGEGNALTPARFTLPAVAAFLYLLVVGSLIGFVAYHWLLGHVPAALAGTHAYVNPVVAILVGWLLGDEVITGWMLGGMAIILAGVALVRAGIVSGPLSVVCLECGVGRRFGS